MKFIHQIIENTVTFFTNVKHFFSIKSYCGEKKNGLFHGKGRLVFKNGSVYEGEFKKNKMDGYGKIFFNDGSIYQGNFKRNLRDGSGLLKDKVGKIERVVFEKGKFKGSYKESFEIIWECNLSGTLEIKCKPNEFMEIFNSMDINTLIKKSVLSMSNKDIKVNDIISYR